MPLEYIEVFGVVREILVWDWRVKVWIQRGGESWLVPIIFSREIREFAEQEIAIGDRIMVQGTPAGGEPTARGSRFSLPTFDVQSLQEVPPGDI
jgi:hypothetical protein